MTERAIHIHEDDWGMRSVIPLGALPEASADMTRSIEAAKRNRAPDGVGWTDVHVIAEPATDFAAAGLSLAAASAALAALMPRIRKFTATATAGFDTTRRDPWGSYEEDAHCYGFDDTCYVKLESEGDLVKTIWFECRTDEPEKLAALRRAFVAIDALVPSAITDYWLHGTGAIADATFLDRYFQALAAEV